MTALENAIKNSIREFVIENNIKVSYSKAKKAEIEAELNRLWDARGKSNDELMNCIHSIMGQGYTIWFDSKADKQLKIIKEVQNA